MKKSPSWLLPAGLQRRQLLGDALVAVAALSPCAAVLAQGQGRLDDHDAHAGHRGTSSTGELDSAHLAEHGQALLSMAMRVVDAFARGGEPFPAPAVAAIQTLANSGDIAGAAREALRLLQTRVLLTAAVTAEARVSVKRTQTRATLVQHGWRLFLVRVNNPSLAPGHLGASSPNAIPVNATAASASTTRGDQAIRWADIDILDDAPLDASLDALPVDFKMLRIYSRDAGRRSAVIALDIGPGTGDIGGRDRVNVDFLILPARQVQLSVRDVDGSPVTAGLLVTDTQGRVLPSQTRRSPPDMFFQKRVYRADGQFLALPAGEYGVEVARGPEYLLQRSVRRVPDSGDARWTFRLERWINPAAQGWYSGDHHIHAAGCAHYSHPEAGVGPEMMMPQVRGEGLSIGSVLTWAPGYHEQKKHFTGRDDAVSDASHILHYDLEVSGFPSSHCGHLALLQMKTMDYPGATQIAAWPSSNAPVLRWAREQGAVTGYAHAGSGLWTGSTDLPNYAMPPFDGIGANDYIVTLPEGLVDFISVCNHPPAAEMNIWYHTLNAGLRSRIAGETDWPCFFEESVGMGRSYVHLDDRLSYSGWCEGLRKGRSYVSEGRAHLMNFRAQSGARVADVGLSDLVLDAPAPVSLTVDFAARLEPSPTPATETIRNSAPMDKPYWHLERARVGTTRSVIVELLVNGIPVEARAVAADGAPSALTFQFTAQRSCWVALRVNLAAHTNPIWISVQGAPIAVRRSAEWCRAAVDRCWDRKSVRVRPGERNAEQALYDRARRYYDSVMARATA